MPPTNKAASNRTPTVATEQQAQLSRSGSSPKLNRGRSVGISSASNPAARQAEAGEYPLRSHEIKRTRNDGEVGSVRTSIEPDSAGRPLERVVRLACASEYPKPELRAPHRQEAPFAEIENQDPSIARFKSAPPQIPLDAESARKAGRNSPQCGEHGASLPAPAGELSRAERIRKGLSEGFDRLANGLKPHRAVRSARELLSDRSSVAHIARPLPEETAEMRALETHPPLQNLPASETFPRDSGAILPPLFEAPRRERRPAAKIDDSLDGQFNRIMTIRVPGFEQIDDDPKTKVLLPKLLSTRQGCITAGEKIAKKCAEISAKGSVSQDDLRYISGLEVVNKILDFVKFGIPSDVIPGARYNIVSSSDDHEVLSLGLYSYDMKIDSLNEGMRAKYEFYLREEFFAEREGGAWRKFILARQLNLGDVTPAIGTFLLGLWRKSFASRSDA